MYRTEVPLASVAAGAIAAAFLFVAVLLGAGDVLAESASLRGTTADASPVLHAEPMPMPGVQLRPMPRPLPALPPYVAPAEPGDALAALEAVEIALKEASDGSTYVWHRDNGRLAGAFRPTSTFRDGDGRVCRHLEMRMRLGSYQRQVEGIACRAPDGVWMLEG